MSEFEWFSLGKEFGLSGLMLLVVWRLVDKWAGKFLQAQQQQAVAMSSLAEGIKSAQSDQRDILLAVQVQSTEIKGMKEALQEFLEVRVG